jgi:hypothetical protein
MEECYLPLCHLYLPKEKRTSICVRSTFLTTWAHVATQGLLCYLGPAQLNLYEPASIIGKSDNRLWKHCLLSIYSTWVAS